MKAKKILKTLFTCSVQEYILGAHSSKSAEQRVNLVENIQYQIMREGSSVTRKNRQMSIKVAQK